MRSEYIISLALFVVGAADQTASFNDKVTVCHQVNSEETTAMRQPASIRQPIDDTSTPRGPSSLRQVATNGNTSRRNPRPFGAQRGQRLLQVVGRFAYEPPGSSAISGVDTIYVEVRDDDTIGHSVIWSGFTDTNGYFDTGVVDITNDDHEPDLYVYFETDSPVVTVEDATVLAENYSWDSFDSLLVDDFQGEFFDFGTHLPTETGVLSNSTGLGFFQAITRAHRFVLQSTNINASKVNVVWPTDDNRFYDYDGEILVANGNGALPKHVLHQFAHHLEREVGMVVSATNDCANDCQYCEAPGGGCGVSLDRCPWCPKSSGVARSEAFAEWFASALGRHFHAQYEFDSGAPFSIVSTGFLEYFPPETIIDTPQNPRFDLSEARELCGADVIDNADLVPAAIEGFLEDLADPLMDDHAGNGLHDCSYLTDGAVLTTYLFDKPADVLALIDLLVLEYPNYVPEMYSAAHNMSPVYTDRFPSDIDPPGVVSGLISPSHPVGEGNTLPCITLELQLPPDDASGACGYSLEWTSDPAGLEPDMIEDVSATCVMTVGPIDLGENYVSIRARDCAGNWSADWATFGPFVVNDCNDNGIVDACETDCAPDPEDVGGCSLATLCALEPECGQEFDCNSNVIPDACDVADGASEDCNEDETPDECQNFHHWVGGSGSWHEGLNWVEGDVPISDNSICIDDPATDATVTFDSGDAILRRVACFENLVIAGTAAPWVDMTIRYPSFVRGNLTFGGHQNSDLTLESYVIVDGLLILNRGTITGNGSEGGLVQIKANGGFRVDSRTNFSNIYLDQDNASSSVALDNVSLGGGSLFRLRPNCSYDYQGDGGVFQGTSGTFQNEGTLTRSSGVNTAIIDVFADNTGTIHAKTGTFELKRRSTSTGQIIGDSGTEILFTGGGHEMLPASSLVADTVRFQNGISGTNKIRGTYNVTSATIQDGGKAVTFTNQANIVSYGQSLELPKGTLNFEAVVGSPIIFQSISIGTPGSHAGTANFASGDPVSTNSLLIGPGTVKGSSDLTVYGLLTWRQGGTFTGPSELHALGGISIESGGSAKTLNSGRILNNGAQATFLGGFVMASSSVVNNLSSGIMDIQVDGIVVSDQGGSAVNNAGTIVKSAGAGRSSINVSTINTGLVEVQIGELEFGDEYAQTDGETRLNGGHLRMSDVTTPMAIDLNGGLFTGSGTMFADVSQAAGTIAPGLPDGVLHIDGDFVQQTGAVVAVDLGGSANCDNIDQLTISGSATLAGKLSISVTGDCQPVLDQTFDVLLFDSAVGGLDSYDGMGLGNGLQLSPLRMADRLSLRVTTAMPADSEGDGDIDAMDVAAFVLCASGPGVPPTPGCENQDVDSDGDVDVFEFSVIQRCFSGENQPVDPDCS